MLKYVLLKLLATEPRHGYDLMRLFGERGWGRLAAGSLYPTLAKLEEAGFIEGRDEGAKRTYHVTPLGRERLRELAGVLESEFENREAEQHPAWELGEAFERLSRTLSVAASAKPETAAQIVAKLEGVRKDIYMLLANE